MKRTLLIVAISLLFASSAIADSDETREEITERARIVRNLWSDFQERFAGVRLRFTDAAHVGAIYDDTHLYWVAKGVSIDGAVPIANRKQRLSVSLSMAVIDPITKGSTRFLEVPSSSDDPFDPLVESSLGLGARFPIYKSVTGVVTTGLSARHEIGGDLRSALAIGGSLALEASRGDWLRVRLGVGLGSGIDRAKFKASPVFRIRIRPLPRVWVEADATSGRIEWDYSRRIDLSLFGGVDSRRYRLRNRGVDFGAGTIVFDTSEVGIGCRIRISPRVRVAIEGALLLGQRISLLDGDRNTIDQRESREPSAALRVSFDWRP